MNKNSERMLRKLKFIAETKMNNFPNAESFARKLSAYEGEDGQPFGCSARTIARDIKDLIEVHKAPLEYDPTNRGYFLRDNQWEFSCPVFEDDFVSMAMLGTRLAADILPEPLKRDVDNAVAQTMAANHSDFFDNAMIESLLCASGIKAAIEPALFKALFDAWRRKHVLNLVYKNTKGEVSEYLFEPHIIAFHHGAWYSKGYLHGTKEIRVFAVQRIVSAKDAGKSFAADKKLIADTRKNGLFIYEKVAGIRLHCDAGIAFYIHEQQKKHRSRQEKQADGSLIVNLEPTVEHEVIRWILAEGGRIRVLEPAWLRQKIAEAGKAIMDNNQ